MSPHFRFSNFDCPLIILLSLFEPIPAMFIILALICALMALPSTLASCGPINEVALTFYGSPEISAPGPDTAFDCGRSTSADGESMAGGTKICFLDPCNI